MIVSKYSKSDCQKVKRAESKQTLYISELMEEFIVIRYQKKNDNTNPIFFGLKIILLFFECVVVRYLEKNNI